MTRRKNLPEYWDRTDNFYNFTTNVRGALARAGDRRRGSVRARSRPATRSRASPAARWAPTTRSPSARTTRAAARSTPASATRRRASTPTCRRTCKGAIDWAAGQSDPAYSDCGATVLRELPAGQGHRAAEPQRADRLRPVPRRPHRSRPRVAAACACTTRPRARRRSSPTSRDPALPTTLRIYTNSEDGLYGPARRQQLRHQQLGVPLLLAADRHRTSSSRRAQIVTQTTPNTTVPNSAASLTAWDPYVGYFQLSRFKFVDDAPGAGASRPELRAADPAGHQQPPGVLPRRGRHRLRQAQQPVDGHG